MKIYHGVKRLEEEIIIEITIKRPDEDAITSKLSGIFFVKRQII